ncbi:RNA polymerase sigma factor SigZ [Salicibibacter cibarius]|uniref:RNA polymerase sigma factor SigZ n=1 Tax=Salicibibacter cibarius TaxID=2743000 RepID=A0A7T6Z3X9_9BACI|nr:RNA polymerase sigma factor SigZ [Salicibibacter cibarius]QQK76287.1 RNA polymerase sigma factor SigZ [Salicibibacter cibarius]
MDFQSVWTEFKDPLHRFIVSRVSNQKDTEDILQEVFIKVHNHLPDLQEKGKLRSWLYQITRNTIIDFYRKKSNGVEFPDAEMESKVINKNDMTDEENINEVVSVWLTRFIDQLPEKYRTALYVTEFENMTQKELADQLGISMSGAKSRVQRARKKLKNQLLECCYLNFDRFGNILDYKINHGNSICDGC